MGTESAENAREIVPLAVVPRRNDPRRRRGPGADGPFRLYVVRHL